jgi:hypothetical protein
VKLSFKDVDLFKITPATSNLCLMAKWCSKFQQNDEVYKPTASLVIDHLNNETDLEF